MIQYYIIYFIFYKTIFKEYYRIILFIKVFQYLRNYFQLSIKLYLLKLYLQSPWNSLYILIPTNLKNFKMWSKMDVHSNLNKYTIERQIIVSIDRRVYYILCSA